MVKGTNGIGMISRVSAKRCRQFLITRAIEIIAKCNSRRTVRSLCIHKRSVSMNHELDEHRARVESKLEDYLLLRLRQAAPTLKHQHLKQSLHGRTGSRQTREPRSSILSNQRCTLEAGIVGMAVGRLTQTLIVRSLEHEYI